jgi:predicted small secreted protein
MSPRISPSWATTRTRTSPRRWRSSAGVEGTDTKTFRLRDGTIGELPRSFSRQTGELTMLRKITTMVLIGTSLAIAACNTVRGTAKDLNSAANAVDNAT